MVALSSELVRLCFGWDMRRWKEYQSSVDTPTKTTRYSYRSLQSLFVFTQSYFICLYAKSAATS